MNKGAILLSLLILSLSTAGGFMISQSHQQGMAQAQSRNADLNKQVNDLQKQLQAAQAKIDTSKWQRACDTMNGLCLKYPSDWKVKTSPASSSVPITVIRITNAANTATVNYVLPGLKDGGTLSAHIVNVADLKLEGATARIVGSYPVSSGIYMPGYQVINSGGDNDSTPGTIGFSYINPRFAAGKQTSIGLTGGYTGKPMASAAQAVAWFDGTDGKTVASILQSLATK